MKKILMIATGGTIASAEGGDGLTPAMTGEELAASVPGIKDKCDLTVLQLMNIDSTNMRPYLWGLMRDAITEHYNDYDGFVILHGTDTMAYTAAALSYLIQNSAKPIVLTGSQKPMGNPYTDAKINIYQSILYALDDNSCDVSIVFNGKVVAGTRARKQRTRSFDAFESMNFPLLAVIHDDRIIRHYIAPTTAQANMVSYQRLNDRVFVLKLTPEVKADIFELFKKNQEFLPLFETCKGFCIPHFGDLVETAESALSDKEKKAFYAILFPMMEQNMQRLSDDLDWFCDKFDYRNKDADWRTSKDALPRGMQKAAGGYPADEPYTIDK